jgi:hypothetical protein
MAGNEKRRNGNWTFVGWKKLRELEVQNIDLDAIYPSESPEQKCCVGSKKYLLLAISALIVVVVAVVLGVVPSKGNGDEATSVPQHPTSAGPPTSPTLPPTEAPAGGGVTEQFLRGLPQYSVELASTKASSPQARTLAWLKKDLHYTEYELFRLNQRYALAVLYYSTNGELWKNHSGWLSNANECTWYSFSNINVCGYSSEFLYLNFWANGLDGSIPTELELLTSLQSCSYMATMPHCQWRCTQNCTYLCWHLFRTTSTALEFELAPFVLLRVARTIPNFPI